jgi:hypothetical protein
MENEEAETVLGLDVGLNFSAQRVAAGRHEFANWARTSEAAR